MPVNDLQCSSFSHGFSDCLALQMKPAASVADPAAAVSREFGVCTGSSLLLSSCPVPKTRVLGKIQP